MPDDDPKEPAVPDEPKHPAVPIDEHATEMVYGTQDPQTPPIDTDPTEIVERRLSS